MPRPSHVRDAVSSRLAQADRHSWTVEEMSDELRSRGTRADFSSVFRAMAWCESEGMVQRIDIGDGRAHYELTGDHHEHAQCERCGSVAEVPGCLVEDAAQRLKKLTGFSVNTHRLVFVGLCPNCQ